MSAAQHIPIHPRFASKTFNIPFSGQQPHPNDMRFHSANRQTNEPSQEPFDQFQANGRDTHDGDFDLFEVPSDIQKNEEIEQKKKPYDMMIIIMTVVIIILIVVVIWLMLSNNDEPVPEKNVQPPQFMRPPAEMMGYPQAPNGFRMQPQAQYAQPQQPYQPQQPPQQQQQPPQQQQQPPPPSKAEMDSVYQALKQKSAKNEKLSVDQYTVKREQAQSSYTVVDPQKKNVSTNNQPKTLETIAEETSNDEDGYEEEYTYDPDETIQLSE